MVFSSTTVLFVYLPVVLAVYFLWLLMTRTYCNASNGAESAQASRKEGKDPKGWLKQGRNVVLLIASLVFYIWGEPKLILVMLATILVNYILALICAGCRERGQVSGAKTAVILSILFSIGTLAFFKYSNFFLTNLNGSIGKLAGFSIPLLEVTLPLGISFYTFQTLSYTIDVYRGDVKVQKNLISLATYVSLFPQLIAGPIVRYQTVQEELEHRKESVQDFSDGVRRFVIGLGKKVLLGNVAGSVFDLVGGMTDHQVTVGLLWLSSFAFTFQIYFDFSGYSDMAIGLGKMFGFHFLENFDHPYESKSITEFWRRWHMSLSSWFRDYIYIPLGGNRKGKVRTYVNLFVVWLLTGFWHGAAWNFVLWGLYFYIILMIEKNGVGDLLKKAPDWVQHLYALFLINFSWVIFSYDDVQVLGTVVKRMFGFGGIPLWSSQSTFYLLEYALIFIIMAVGVTTLPGRFAAWWKEHVFKNREGLITLSEVVGILIVMLLATASLASDAFNPFLYFRF